MKKIDKLITVPTTKRVYDQIVDHLDLLIDEIGNDQDHPKALFMEKLGSLIEAWENKNIAIPKNYDPKRLK